MDKARELMKKRDDIDEQLAVYLEVLKANKVDMTSSLVDEQQFPRGDIDVYSVRDARVHIIRLQNDRAAVSREIEEQLAELHANTSSNSESSETGTVHRTTNRPFVRVGRVELGSPADEGGLKPDDLIVQFDRLHGDNYKNIEQLSEVMKSVIGKTLKATILRGTTVKRLEFHPRQWSGKGVFGAGFLSIDTSDIL